MQYMYRTCTHNSIQVLCLHLTFIFHYQVIWNIYELLNKKDMPSLQKNMECLGKDILVMHFKTSSPSPNKIFYLLCNSVESNKTKQKWQFYLQATCSLGIFSYGFLSLKCARKFAFNN